jgi:nucleoside 2-deoxyribosyltransferase
MTKVYLASRYGDKAQTQKYADDLKFAGFECTSNWLTEPHEADSLLSDLTPDLKIEYARQDVKDVLRSDVFVVFTAEEHTPIIRGGHVFETGMAYAAKIPILVVGPRQCLFHWLPEIQICPTWELALEHLKRLFRPFKS